MRRRAAGQAALEQLETAPQRPAGVLILGADLRCQGSTPAAQGWLAVLPGAAIASSRGYLPQTIYAVAARALAAECPSVTDLPARLRTRTVDGHWAVIEAAPLQGSYTDGIAVTLRSATSAEIVGLVAMAHALTPREREVLQLVTAGLPTPEIAGSLCISRHTLQDHLKVIFDKIGVRNRRELIRRMT